MSTLTKEKPFLRVSDIAKRYDVTTATVRNWIVDGLSGTRLKAKKAARTGMWFVTEDDLEDFMTTSNEADDSSSNDYD